MYEPPRAYAYRYRLPYSYVHPHRHYQNGQHHLTHPERHAYGDATAYEYQYQQTGTGRNIQAQVQGQGGQPIRAVHPPPQQAVPCPPPAVPVHPPISTSPYPLVPPYDKLISQLTEETICRCDARFFGGISKPRECVLPVTRRGYRSSCNL